MVSSVAHKSGPATYSGEDNGLVPDEFRLVKQRSRDRSASQNGKPDEEAEQPNPTANFAHVLGERSTQRSDHGYDYGENSVS